MTITILRFIFTSNTFHTNTINTALAEATRANEELSGVIERLEHVQTTWISNLDALLSQSREFTRRPKLLLLQQIATTNLTAMRIHTTIDLLPLLIIRLPSTDLFRDLGWELTDLTAFTNRIQTENTLSRRVFHVATGAARRTNGVLSAIAETLDVLAVATGGAC
jgi:hypothetical protein